MPWPKATQYRRFNVGQYMKQKRLENLRVEQRTKKAQATARRLKRLEERVSFHYITDFLYA